MTPICRESPPSLPDPQARTDQLRADLQRAITALRAADTPHGALIAAELEAMHDALIPPPESYPGLTEMDKALGDAFSHLEDLSRYAPLAEIQQILKSLRRMVLIDRTRIDPDAQRHATAVAISLRQLWLIGHRAGLLKANMQQLQLSQALASGRLDPQKHAQYQEALGLLTQYLTAQEGYGASIRQELEELQASILF